MITRRALCTFFAIAPFAATPLKAGSDQVIDLTWTDLIPPESRGVLWESARLSGVVEHGELSTGFDQPEASALTDEFDGQIVRIPGFMVPLDFDADGVTAFILAPFVGACIHVPPPPANQLILVTTPTPYAYEGLFEAVTVTGMFGVAATGTALADIGYALSADKIEPYSA